ncbi:MAG TPA: phosphoenolpyruvate--protein phosphotransferase [Phycisphaerae bacterium]|nr:phosphoenolpyruvate--protein phosphotransferase [Phycisphaerae bacterium]HRW54762.1 phosphoenolpyruvate--protein phosphotransferase [Phycisphaerae bacterium]
MPLRRGIGVSSGVVIGDALVLETEESRVPRRIVPRDQIDHEVSLADRAFESARKEVADEREQFAARAGNELADIFGFHERWLGDVKPRKEIASLIRSKHYSSAYAISVFMRKYRRRFQEMGSPFLQERAKDIQDIERRLLHHVGGETRMELASLREPVIIVAHDLTPSELVALEKTKRLLGFATDAGGTTSHTAIIAAGLGIPAVVGLENITSHVSSGDTLVIDGLHGVVVVNPDESQRSTYAAEAKHLEEVRDTLAELTELAAETRDGVRINLLGNIEFPLEIDDCINRGAEGIGLFRTEFLFLEADPLPGEEDQYRAYCDAVTAVGDRPLVIRTMDLGGDKCHRGGGWEVEKNPFLGLRSIRYSLQNLSMFRSQLRAILRASVNGDVRVMFPLISRIMELRQAKFVLSLVMEELEEEGFEFKSDIPVGVMVETPAAAICARELARETDFMSIGTNDLIQYTLAVDRTNERVAQLYSPADPSILRLIRRVVKDADRSTTSISLCGEMAGDPLFAILLVGMGLRTLSMAAGNIPRTKKIIRSISLADAIRVRKRVMSFETEREVLNYLRDETRKVWDEI